MEEDRRHTGEDRCRLMLDDKSAKSVAENGVAHKRLCCFYVYMRTCAHGYLQTNKITKKNERNIRHCLKIKKTGTSSLFQCLHVYMCTCSKKSRPKVVSRGDWQKNQYHSFVPFFHTLVPYPNQRLKIVFFVFFNPHHTFWLRERGPAPPTPLLLAPHLYLQYISTWQ